jgi:hypothetical protein
MLATALYASVWHVQLLQWAGNLNLCAGLQERCGLIDFAPVLMEGATEKSNTLLLCPNNSVISFNQSPLTRQVQNL